MKVVDLFCGAGGFSLGFEVLEDFEVVYAIDNDPKCLETFRHNFPETEVVEENVRNVEEIPNADVVIGGPPCPNFSLANKKRDPKAGMELVHEFLRLKDTADPDYWIMENVPQVTNHIARKDFPRYRVYNCANYGVPQKRKRCFAGEYPRPEQTHAEQPQRTLDGRELKPWVTVWDAIWDLMLTPTKEEIEKMNEIETDGKKISFGKRDSEDHYVIPNLKNPIRTILSSANPGVLLPIPDHNPELGASLEEWEEKEEKYGTQNPLELDESSPTIKAQEIARNKKFPHHFLVIPDHNPEELSEKARDYLRRDPRHLKKHRPRELDEPSRTIPADVHKGVPYGLVNLPGSTIDSSGYLYEKGHHESQTDARLRRLTVRECARLQSFPDWFEFRGSKTSKYRQVGNAVPPLMAYRFAEAIREAENRG